LQAFYWNLGNSWCCRHRT